MTKPELPNNLPCPFLSHIPPSQLVSSLARWSKENHPYLNPIWLHNEGQNIIGFLPQKAFYLLAPPPITTTNNKTETITDELQLITLTRKAMPNFSSLYEESHRESDKESHTDNNHNDLQLTLINGQNIERFIEQLMGYMDSVENDIIDSDNHHHSNSSVKTSAYQDGLMGFIGYDVMASHLANNGQFAEKYFQQGQPTAYFGHYPLYLTCDIVNNQHHWKLHARTPETIAVLTQVQDWLQRVIKSVSPLIPRPPIFQPPSLSLEPVWNKRDYKLAFDHTQSYLYAGDCYQINLTQSWQGQLTDGVLLADYLPRLHAHTNAPYACYLHAPSPNQSNSMSHILQMPFELLSCSPELFFTFDKTGKITTKPIKGTRPRGKDNETDNRLKDELANSKKDLAENVMIVDLLRNDLGKYAKTGTVKVPKRFAIESFSNVHHMVSTITATIKEDIHPLEVLFGSLPVGSITGTPKKRAVEIINELESHTEKQSRGAYCGTMGYLNFDGSGQWNVLIRSLQANEHGVSLWAGGGITVASECEAEYQECFDKVGNILQVLLDD